MELAPATPIPLHAGAARYYRERELFQFAERGGYKASL
jgi:hypothetical protein